MFRRESFLSAIVVLGLALGAPAQAAEPHAHGAPGAAVHLRLDNGKRWQTDDVLRRGMTAIRAAVEEACGSELLDEDTDEVVDVVLLWWRDGDGDLVDTLMDAISPLAEDGVIWVLTPKTGKPGHVLPADIAEAAPTAGLMPTSSVNLGDWAASRLVQPKSRAGKR